MSNKSNHGMARYIFGLMVSTILVIAPIRSAMAQGVPAPEWLPGDGYPGVNGSVSAIKMWDSDGVGPQPARLVIAGTFTIAGNALANNMAMWNPVTGQWSSLGSGMDGGVLALTTLPNGDILAGGYFSTAGGVIANGIARWNGNAWAPLGAGTGETSGGYAHALAVLPNGEIIAGGSFRVTYGGPADCIARWNGSGWLPLGAGMSGGSSSLSVNCLAVLSNGDLVAGGNFSSAGGVTANMIARWNGSGWSSLGTGMDYSVDSLAVLPNGDLVAGGSFGRAGGIYTHMKGIARWNGNAWVAMGFGMSSGSTAPRVASLAVHPNGDLIAGGSFYWADDISAHGIARWNGNGWAPLGTGTDMGGYVSSIAALPNGDVIVGGGFGGTAVPARGIVRWNGASWSALANGMDNNVYELAVLPGGDLVAGGEFKTAGSVIAEYAARWNGNTWSAMGSFRDEVNALTVMPNGELIAGGSCNGILPTDNIARWNGNGWTSLGLGTDETVECLITLPGGDLIAGGFFSNSGGVSASRIARWNGATWSALGTGMGGTGEAWVIAMVVQPNGDLIAGGTFESAGGVAASRIARWNGSVWAPLGTGVDGAVYAIATLPNGDLIAGGAFRTAGGVTANRIARWNGSIWSALGAGMTLAPFGYGIVTSLAVLPNGDLVAAGDFDTAGGVAANRIARWNGSEWSALGLGVNKIVYALAVLPNGDLAVGGAFTTAGQNVSAHFARYGFSLWNGPTGTEQRIDYNVGNVYVGTALSANPVVRSDVVDMANSGRTIAFHAFAGTPTNGARTTAIWGETNNPNGRGLQGFNFATGPWTTGPSAGLWGESASSNGQGVRARATSTTGQNYAGYFDTASNAGAVAYAISTSGTGTTYGVWGNVASSAGFAGSFTGGKNYFSGKVGIGTNAPAANLHVIGTLTASGAKNFLIDHPSDPEHMILRHSCVESDGYKDIYDGIDRTDGQGYAEVQLPDWFCDLNQDFRYHLTVLDDTDEVWPIATISKKIDHNTFTIRTLLPNTEVSWQITATRKDAWATAHPLILEEPKIPQPDRRWPEIPNDVPLTPITNSKR